MVKNFIPYEGLKVEIYTLPGTEKDSTPSYVLFIINFQLRVYCTSFKVRMNEGVTAEVIVTEFLSRLNKNNTRNPDGSWNCI